MIKNVNELKERLLDVYAEQNPVIKQARIDLLRDELLRPGYKTSFEMGKKFLIVHKHLRSPENDMEREYSKVLSIKGEVRYKNHDADGCLTRFRQASQSSGTLSAWFDDEMIKHNRSSFRIIKLSDAKKVTKIIQEAVPIDDKTYHIGEELLRETARGNMFKDPMPKELFATSLGDIEHLKYITNELTKKEQNMSLFTWIQKNMERSKTDNLYDAFLLIDDTNNHAIGFVEVKWIEKDVGGSINDFTILMFANNYADRQIRRDDFHIFKNDIMDIVHGLIEMCSEVNWGVMKDNTSAHNIYKQFVESLDKTQFDVIISEHVTTSNNGAGVLFKVINKKYEEIG